MRTTAKASWAAVPESLLIRLNPAIGTLGLCLTPLALRVALGLPFLRSGLTRWDGFFSLSPATQYLFEEVFRLHLLGQVIPIPFPEASSLAVAVLEIVLPILLFAGLGTRISAALLLAMTCIIQLVFPDGWMNFHLNWAAMALALMALGAGPVSVDRWLARFAGKSL